MLKERRYQTKKRGCVIAEKGRGRTKKPYAEGGGGELHDE